MTKRWLLVYKTIQRGYVLFHVATDCEQILNLTWKNKCKFIQLPKQSILVVHKLQNRES